MSVLSESPRSLHAAIIFLTVVFTTAVVSAQSITPAPRSQSTQPQMAKSPAGKEEEAARAAARSTAHHFDRVLIIVLENVDYEVASQDKSLAELAAGGASLTNFHAMFHPSYPNYLAMVAGTDFGIHRRGRLLADNQVNYPADAAHQTIADRLLGVMTEARKKEVSWVMRRDLKIDPVEVGDIEQRFLETVRTINPSAAMVGQPSNLGA